ncbi:MAG: hypothetical protein ABIQ44_00030 [Chloroflexia bacterium]
MTTYFLENLTLVNINASPADELAGALDVGDDLPEAIIARGERQPFVNMRPNGADRQWKEDPPI